MHEQIQALETQWRMSTVKQTFSFDIEPCRTKCCALGNSGSKVPVFELREYFRVNPPF